VQTVLISSQPVELFKILKFEGICASGAEAKLLIAAGEVFVDGQPETRKRRKMHDGDCFEIFGEKYCLELSIAG